MLQAALEGIITMATYLFTDKAISKRRVSAATRKSGGQSRRTRRKAILSRITGDNNPDPTHVPDTRMQPYRQGPRNDPFL